MGFITIGLYCTGTLCNGSEALSSREDDRMATGIGVCVVVRDARVSARAPTAVLGRARAVRAVVGNRSTRVFASNLDSESTAHDKEDHENKGELHWSGEEGEWASNDEPKFSNHETQIDRSIDRLAIMSEIPVFTSSFCANENFILHGAKGLLVRLG